MIRFSISILTILFSLSCLYSKNLFEDARDFDSYQKTFSKEEVQEKIKTMLEQEPSIRDYYDIKEHALEIYASKEDKQKGEVEFALEFGSKPKVQKKIPVPQSSQFPLKDLRIAIDPGHFGGEFARLEERYIHMRPLPERGIFEEIEFNEGELAVITAKKLAQKLEALGAEVLLTKTKPGEAVYKKSYEVWMKENFDEAIASLEMCFENPDQQKQERKYWIEKASESEIFRSTYNFLDIQRRAEIINAFKPHVTIACHYNLGGIYDKEGYTPGVDFDYTLFFVPGAFRATPKRGDIFKQGSLQNERTRYEFVRLLVTKDLEQSISLAQLAQKHAVDQLALPPGDQCSYLKVLCMKQGPGIYHRNLSLPRLVHSPILYAEPFCQDNYEKASILSSNPEILIDKVVDIHLKAILDWAALEVGRK